MTLLAQTASATPTPPPEAAEAASRGILDLVFQAGPVVQLVMLLLVAASIACWTIIFAKLKLMRKAKAQSEEFLDAFWNSQRIEDVYQNAARYSASPLSQVFRSGYSELMKVTGKGEKAIERADAALESIGRSMSRARRTEVNQLQKSIPFLATTGSASPFIGLFGTVWGIMNSFLGLIDATSSATIQAVAPGIAEALIATAMGLAAAIPAVIFYNLLVGRIKVLAAEMDNFTGDFLNIIDRHYL